jgi:hypothetical protein
MRNADKAEVAWDSDKKLWRVRIQIGEEVIKRPAGKTPADAPDDALRSLAVEIAADEGYGLDRAQVTITR